MADTIGEQLKEARESLCTAIFTCINSFETDTGVIVESVHVSLEEVKSGGGALEAKTERKHNIFVTLNL